MVPILNPDFARDLVMTGAIFGIAAFIWAGWAQEDPPPHWMWRVILGAFSAAGIVLAAFSIPAAVRNWDSASAIEPGGAGFVLYLVVFWAEVIIGIALAIIAIRMGRPDLVAPLILALVGIHFVALAPVFGQPVLYIVAALLSFIAVVAVFFKADDIAPSFWCGILGAPVFLVVGTWCTVVGLREFAGT